MRPTTTTTYAGRRFGRAPRLDVHAPDLPGPHPVIVVSVGGAWPGARRRPAAVGLTGLLVDAGFVVVAYDPSPTFGPRFPAAVDDLRAVLGWVRAHADALDVDVGRIGVVGIGLGAAVAAVAADEVHRVACFYGPYDFTALPLGRVGAWALLDETDPRRIAWRSPTNACVTASPVLLLHGTADRLVPVCHAERLAASRTRRGLPVRLRLYPGVGHGFLGHPGLAVWDDAAGELLSFLFEP